MGYKLTIVFFNLSPEPMNLSTLINYDHKKTSTPLKKEHWMLTCMLKIKIIKKNHIFCYFLVFVVEMTQRLPHQT